MGLQGLKLWSLYFHGKHFTLWAFSSENKASAKVFYCSKQGHYSYKDIKWWKGKQLLPNVSSICHTSASVFVAGKSIVVRHVLFLEQSRASQWSLCKVKRWKGHRLKISSKHHSKNGIFRFWQSFFIWWRHLKFDEIHFLFREGHSKVGEASCHISGEKQMKRNSKVLIHLPKVIALDYIQLR